MKKKVAKKSASGTTGVVTYGAGYKGPQLEKSATGRPAPAMKKGGSVKKK
jgi:hypothetical protein